MAVIPGNDDEFRRVLDENKYVIVKYYAEWSGTCKLLLPKFTELSEDPNFEDVTFVDVDLEANPQIKKEEQIEALPCFAIYEKGERIFIRTIATDDEMDEVEEALVKLVD